MSELRGSRTERNLVFAYLAECEARNRYGFFAKQAEKEGFVAIAAAFEETAEQERSHAKNLHRFLVAGEVVLEGTVAVAAIGTTLENLRSAVAGETHECEDLYPAFAAVARDEGFPAIAAKLAAIAVAERRHATRFAGLLAHVEAGDTFRRDEPVTWLCRKCGYTHEGTEAPKACPACAHPQGWFEVAS